MKHSGLILDLGCGDGRWLKENGGNLAVGIDIDKKKLKLAASCVKNGTSFILADGSHLCFKDNCFDFVYVGGVLHHIKDFRKTISEISRVLKGSLYLEEAVDDYLLFAIARRITKNWRGIPIHSFFHSNKLLTALKESNFKLLKITYKNILLINQIFLYFSIPIPKPLHYLNKLYGLILNITRLSKFFACHICITASKSKTSDSHLFLNKKFF